MIDGISKKAAFGVTGGGFLFWLIPCSDGEYHGDTGSGFGF